MGVIIGRKKNNEEQAKPNTNTTNPLSGLLSVSSTDNRNFDNTQILIGEWLDKKHIIRKTNLNQNQINQICILMSLANQFKIKPLKDLIMNFLTLMISKDSASATQLVNILQSRGLLEKEDLDLVSKFAK